MKRAQRYRRRLEAQGYEARVLEDTTGVFSALTVFDPATNRHGFVDPRGEVTWLNEIQDFQPGAQGKTVQSQPIDLDTKKKGH